MRLKLQGLALMMGLAFQAPRAFAAPDAAVAEPSDAAAAPAAASAPSTPPPAEAVPAGREGFVVQPFTNTKKIRALDHLARALPSFVAERLAQQPPLRYEGEPTLCGRTPTPAARWLVTGSFERQKDWKVAVTVEVRPAAAPEEIAASATRVAERTTLSATVLEAAVAAFGATPGITLAPASLTASARAPFSRDPYAFVLYGRAVAAICGDGKRPQAGAAHADHLVKQIQHALVIDPRVPEIRRLLALAHLEAGRPGHARAALTSALDEHPDYVAALRTLAALDRAAGLPIARERYARVLTLDPQDLDARRAHGELLSEAGQLPEAQAELEKVLAVTPDDLRARRSLVLVLAARHAGKELVVELEEVVRLDPESIDARMDLAAAYLGVGQSAEASRVYDEVLRRRPRNAIALKLSGDLARERGDLKTAAGTYAKLRALAPSDPRPVFLMAAAYLQAGDLPAAERLYNQATHFPGLRSEALSNLGALALKRNEPKQALLYLEQAAKTLPVASGVRYNHALALHDIGRDAEAYGELQVSTALDPEDAGTRFLMGIVALRLGLPDEAAQCFRAALTIDPNHADARHNLALLDSMGAGREGSLSFVNGERGALEPPIPRPR